MAKNRLSKVMAAAGVASRRACEQLIFDGKVAVNGKIVLLPQTLVDSDRASITVEGKSITAKEPKVYYMLNKPKGYLCTSKPSTRARIVLELFKGIPYRLFTVGRLDRDTSGLIIVTNDGHFANKVIHPSSEIQKEYLVKTFQELDHEHLVKISEGTHVEEVFVKPVRVTKVRRGTAKIVVMEGKKREVRKLFEDAGLKVLELSRIRIGSLTLNDLPSGVWRELSEKERKSLFE